MAQNETIAQRDPDVRVPTGDGLLPVPSGPWTDRVTPSENDYYAYRPNEILTSGEANRLRIEAYLKARNIGSEATNIFGDGDEEYLIRVSGDVNIELTVAELEYQGIRAEPNVVFFNHSGGGCGCGCGGGFGGNPFSGNPFSGNPFSGNPFSGNPFSGNPFSGNPFSGNPFSGNPFSGNPFSGNPFSGNPFSGNPFSGNPFSGNPFSGNPFSGNPFSGNAATGERQSSALPAKDPELESITLGAVSRAIVLDTGIAHDLPEMLKLPTHLEAKDHHRDKPDDNGDNILDPVSGHGTFIAGIIEQVAPNQEVHVVRVLTNVGDGDAAGIARQIHSLLHQNLIDEHTILNMSFGSYGDVKMYLIEHAIRLVQAEGAVVVASAGNDNTCMRSYPACLPGVVSVGSIEPHGKAPYSNYGCWVRACAPGTALISSFFSEFDGALPVVEGSSPPINPDHYQSWAQWTGTSFAAPLVAAALMRHMSLMGSTAKDAVKAVIGSPGLLQYPGMGTVVNLVPGM